MHCAIRVATVAPARTYCASTTSLLPVKSTTTAWFCSRHDRIASRQHPQCGDARRYLSTANDESLAESENDAESSPASSSSQSIYPDSRAGLRTRATSRLRLYASRPLLDEPRDKDSKPASHATKAKRRAEGRARVAKTADNSQDSSRMPFPEDEGLKSLMADIIELSRPERSSLRNTMRALNGARKIKIRLRSLHDVAVKSAKEKGDVPPSPPTLPFKIYNRLLQILAREGQDTACEGLVNEMQEQGLDVDIVCLNRLLSAAVHRRNETLVHTALDLISKLPSRTKMRPDRRNDYGSHEEDTLLLSRQWTRNWSATTYSIMFEHCRKTHDLEYCLALLGSASQHILPGEDANAYSSGKEVSTFLLDVLTPNIITTIISIAADNREPRLTADLALWIDQHAGMRSVPAEAWHITLRSCAEDYWFPGMVAAWERTVIRSMMSIDEGLIQSILMCAARAGQPQFIEQALTLWHRRGLTTSSFTLHEWHIAPLIEAYCVKFDFEGAMRAAARLSRVAGHTLSARKDLYHLWKSADSSDATLEAAYEAFIRVGRDPSPGGGVSVIILNALILAANNIDRADITVKLYKARQFVRTASSPPESALPPFPASLTLSEGKSEGGQVDEDLIEDRKGTQTISHTFARHSLHADTETFNELLSLAINRRSRRLAKATMEHLVAAKVPANSVTYERAIVLALTQRRYEAAFSYLSECKARNLEPTAASYTAMALRCLQEQDERWIGLTYEMRKAGHRMPKALEEAFSRIESSGSDGEIYVERDIGPSLTPRLEPTQKASFRSHRP